MNRPLTAALLTLLSVAAPARPGGLMIDPLDALTFRAPKDRGRAELVEGKFGKAVHFTFAKDGRATFFTRSLRPGPEWDRSAGFSFWVKGDGSDHFGGLQFIYDEDYALRYDYCFPIRNSAWSKVTVAWRDLIPVLPHPRARPLGPEPGNPPSKLSALWFGKWWYWRDHPAYSYAVDELRLEDHVAREPDLSPPAGAAPLGRVRARLRAGQPVTVVTMGDSLTDFQHWANRPVAWPLLLRERLREKYGADVTVHNPAIGGTQLRQNLVLIPRWLARVPEPDLVTIWFGYNDWDAGMRGEEFRAACRDAVERVRRATRGKADVLLLTTAPAAERWTTMAELAEACRQAARATGAGLADTEKAFHAAGRSDRARLYAKDRTHLSPAGHELAAAAVLAAIEAD